MANICYRSYIKWQDSDEADRDGKVLVLTSPAKTFVDVRLKPGAQGIQGMLSEANWNKTTSCSLIQSDGIFMPAVEFLQRT
jgi:hypothetical protein